MSTFVVAASAYGPLILNTQDTGVGWQILRNGIHEPEVVDYGRNILTKCFELYGKGVRAVDVGANIGTCTVAWGQHLKDWGHLTAYEAQETVFYALAGNIVLNNLMNTKAIHAAVSSEDGSMRVPEMNFNMPGNYGGLHLLEKFKQGIGPDQPVSYKEPHMVTVPMMTLDSEGFGNLNLLKIDVEGMEPEVLLGSIETIHRYLPVIIAEFIHCGDKNITNILDEIGYTYFQLGGNLACIHKSQTELIKFSQENPPEWKYRL